MSFFGLKRRAFIQGAAGLRCLPSQLAIALDVGHTLTAPGATAASGETEFTYNLSLARRARAALQAAGFSGTFLIGESGASLALEDRTRQARAHGAGMFLSLHHDSVQPQYLQTIVSAERVLRYSNRFHGYGLFISTSNPHAVASRFFATNLGNALRAAGMTPSLHHAENIPGESRLLLDPALGIYRFDELAVLRTATMPAVLLESAIIVNPTEEEEVSSGRLHARVAPAIVKAVLAVCAA